MKTLVTGSNGFIGRNIFADYKIGRDVDLTDYNSTHDFISKLLDVSRIIHCAGKHGSSIEMTKDHASYIRTNFLCDENVLRTAAKLSIPTVAMISSITCIPSNNKDVFDETDLFVGDVNDVVLGYAVSKRMTINLCRAYFKDFAINAVPIVLGNCYGRYGKFNKDSTVIHKLIYDIDLAMTRNEDVYLSGDGRDVRSFLFADDLGEILAYVLSEQREGKPVIVSSPEQVSIIDLVHLMSKLMGYKGNIIFDGKAISPHKKKVAKSINLDVSKFNYTSLEDGIAKTISYFWSSK
jgi:GDP-L-fucose synthase